MKMISALVYFIIIFTIFMILFAFNKEDALSFVLLHLHSPHPIGSTVRPSPIIILRLDLLHLRQHFLGAILLHTAALIRGQAARLGLRAASGRVGLGLLEHPLLGWHARNWDYRRVLVGPGTCKSLHGSSLSLPFLLGHLLLLSAIRSHRIVLILALRPTAVLLRVE
jgi:hypothetical protein